MVKDTDHWRRRQHSDIAATWTRHGCPVAVGRIGAQHMVIDQMWLVIMNNENTAGERCNPSDMRNLRAVTAHAGRMQNGVHFGCAGADMKRALLCIKEPIVICPPAISTGAMTCGHSNGFVEEKQLCPVATCHHVALAPLPIQNATNPRLMGPPFGGKGTIRSVENPAIPRHGAACRDGQNLPSGCTRFCRVTPSFPWSPTASRQDSRARRGRYPIVIASEIRCRRHCPLRCAVCWHPRIWQPHPYHPAPSGLR